MGGHLASCAAARTRRDRKSACILCFGCRNLNQSYPLEAYLFSNIFSDLDSKKTSTSSQSRWNNVVCGSEADAKLRETRRFVAPLIRRPSIVNTIHDPPQPLFCLKISWDGGEQCVLPGSPKMPRKRAINYTRIQNLGGYCETGHSLKRKRQPEDDAGDAAEKENVSATLFAMIYFDSHWM